MQVVVATITSDGDAYALEVRDALRRAGLRADADLRNEKINYKVREHSVQKVPVILVVGKREMDERDGERPPAWLAEPVQHEPRGSDRGPGRGSNTAGCEAVLIVTKIVARGRMLG